MAPMTQDSAPKALFIVGPTASGKSGLAMRIARSMDGEVVCADSQTVRRHLDIGTAKPTAHDQQQVPHHMLDIIEPYDRYSVADYQKAAKQCIQDIQGRGNLPIVVGGTGLYIDALFYDYSLQASEHTDDLTQRPAEELQKIIKEKGYTLPPNAQNPRHLAGVIRREGKTHQDTEPIDGALIIGIERPDEELKERIVQRIDTMIDDGLLDEVRGIMDQYGQPPQDLDAIVYGIAAQHVRGESSLQEFKKEFARRDWQYARRQKSWFKRNKCIQWFSSVDDAYSYCLNTLK